MQIQTYIIKVGSDFYCGKTNDINRRLDEHRKEKEPCYFSFKRRQNLKWNIIYFNGDYEKMIKRAGVKLTYELMKTRYSEVEDIPK